MNVPQEELNAWGGACDALRMRLSTLRADIMRGAKDAARDRLLEADDMARALGLRIERAGAERPPSQPPRPSVPLALLDTPANRRYADKLREAWAAGLAVDRERYGESIGTDGCAQVIELVLADVEAELHGPAGLGE